MLYNIKQKQLTIILSCRFLSSQQAWGLASSSLLSELIFTSRFTCTIIGSRLDRISVVTTIVSSIFKHDNFLRSPDSLGWPIANGRRPSCVKSFTFLTSWKVYGQLLHVSIIIRGIVKFRALPPPELHRPNTQKIKGQISENVFSSPTHVGKYQMHSYNVHEILYLICKNHGFWVRCSGPWVMSIWPQSENVLLS